MPNDVREFLELTVPEVSHCELAVRHDGLDASCSESASGGKDEGEIFADQLLLQSIGVRYFGRHCSRILFRRRDQR